MKWQIIGWKTSPNEFIRFYFMLLSRQEKVSENDVMQEVK